jgi:diguanylate cyclase (GGDEF)-like protein
MGLLNYVIFLLYFAGLFVFGEFFSLLMMVLDSFKAFNDTYGRPAGDALLRTVSGAIISAIRQNDQAYRYGGDEFAVLLRGASSKHASDVVPRVRAAVRDGVQSSAIGGFGVRVTASIGSAHWPADGASGAEIVEAADAALYRDKRHRDAREDQAEPVAETRRSDVVPSLLDAARDLIGATSVDDVASILVRHVSIMYGTPDAFVAVLQEIGDVVPREPVAVSATGSGYGSAGGSERAGSLRRQAMIQVAGTGRFALHPHVARRGPTGGIWGRVWQSGSADEEDRHESRSVGIPIKLGREVVGLIGAVASPAAPLAGDRLQASALLADLGAAAMRRVMGPNPGRD